MTVRCQGPRLSAPAHASQGAANHLRFRLSSHAAIVLAACVKRVGEKFVGDQRELLLLDTQPDEETAYERLLGDAMAGDSALTRATLATVCRAAVRLRVEHAPTD